MRALLDPALRRNRAYVDGSWIEADNGATVDIANPATGEVISNVPRLGAVETRRAIDAAALAFPGWRGRTASQRAVILRRLADLMIENREDLALLLTLEQGKPLVEAEGEITYAASFLEWFGEEAKRVYGDTIPSPSADRRLIVIKEPVGVTAAVTPWNFPTAMVTRKVAPALAAGCTIVVKPAEQTPLSALALCELAERAGVPQGVFNVVTGSADDAPAIGSELTSNPIVRKLSFTGSTEVGKLLLRQCADTVKRVSLELGGNAPFLVFDDADLDEAVAGALLAKFRNSGQTCVCANRILVQEGVYDEFTRRLATEVSNLHVGPGIESGSEIGPLIDEGAVAKVERHVADAISKGARLLVGGKRDPRGGTYYQPTVIADVPAGALVETEETFGPVAAVRCFSSEQEGIELANASVFGLAAYVFSREVGRIWRTLEQLEVGIVGVNTGLISNEVAPFGGVKESGLGREGSRYGIDEWLELKYVCLGGMG